jgi:hypothetical protein
MISSIAAGKRASRNRPGTLLLLEIALALQLAAISAAAQGINSNSAEEILDAALTLEDIAIALGNEDSQSVARAAQELIRRLTPAEIAATGSADYSVLTNKLRLVRASLRAEVAAGAVSALTAATAADGILFDPLPDADYPTVCGDTRTEAETVKLVALQALLFLEEAEALAEEALAAVRHASLETIVALGEGGNTSLVAEPFDIALGVARILKVAAKATLEDLEFVDNCIDSAEIEGSYERLGALGGRTDEIAMRQIETHVSNRRILASLFLPDAHGGRLEAVRDIVALWMTRANDAGIDIRSAQLSFDLGEQRRANQRYRNAYLHYANAYTKIVNLAR